MSYPPQKIVIPMGMINPDETTVIEIPEHLRAAPVIIATKKGPMAKSSALHQEHQEDFDIPSNFPIRQPNTVPYHVRRAGIDYYDNTRGNRVPVAHKVYEQTYVQDNNGTRDEWTNDQMVQQDGGVMYRRSISPRAYRAASPPRTPGMVRRPMVAASQPFRRQDVQSMQTSMGRLRNPNTWDETWTGNI